ncbi:phage tail fiber protein [Terrabacter terrigena]|uniref:Head decoration protein n=1 Tax=Terrabacter terrigena TaxID=574718 RepID=A0ABW3N153_9MICO
MTALDAAHAANIVDASLGTAAFVATTTPIRVRYMTANGTATANGTELATSGGYTSGTGAPSVTFASASTTTGQAASNAAVTTTNMPATTIVGVELWDSAATPKRKWQGALSASKTTNAGDTFTIPSGSLTVTDL